MIFCNMLLIDVLSNYSYLCVFYWPIKKVCSFKSLVFSFVWIPKASTPWRLRALYENSPRRKNERGWSLKTFLHITFRIDLDYAPPKMSDDPQDEDDFLRFLFRHNELS